MVAIFTGNGLGTFNSSVTQLGQGGGTRLGQSRDSYGINAATGNLVIQALDESLLTRGFGTAAVRTYNSRGQVSGVGQDGWVTGYERSAKLTGGFMAADSYVTLSNGEGEDIVFKYDAQRQEYVSTVGAGAHDQMVWDGDNWLRYVDGVASEVYGDGDGDFTTTALLSSIQHQGVQYRVDHDNLGRVTSVHTVSGDASIVYSYVGNTWQLSAVTTSENGVRKGQVTYGYEATTGRLSWVQTDLTPDNGNDNVATGNLDGRLFRTDYTYATSNAADLRIASVRTSDGATVSFEYEPASAGGNRVIAVTEGGVKTRFAYNGTSTDILDASGAVLLTYRYDTAGQMTAMLERAVNGVRACTSFAYDADGNVVRISKYGVDAATGNAGAVLEETRFRYDANGNRTQQRDRLNNIVKWEYGSSNQVVSESRYTLPDGDAIDDDQAGNMASLNLSSALTTHYVYDSAMSDRLRYAIDATGNVRELVYGSGTNDIGQVVIERRFGGNERYTGTLFTATDLDLWASQTSTTTGTPRRANSGVVAYTYDALGRMARSIEYARTTSTGDGDPSDADAITFYTYDIHGLLRQSISSLGANRNETTIDARSLVTDYVYDGMGRLLSVLKRGAGVAATSPSTIADPAGAAAWDAATLLTTYAYVDSQKQIIVTQDSGLLHTEYRDSAGAVVKVVEQPAANGGASAHTMKNYYDTRGRLAASENAAGGCEYYFYDEAGRLAATVDETNAVTTISYDAIGRKQIVRQLATRVDTSGWIQSGAVVVTSIGYADEAAGQATLQTSGDDRWTSYVYDASGRIAGTTDSGGAETTYQYDAANRLVRVTEWGDYYGWGGGSTSLAKRFVPQPSGRDARVTRMFYDSADRLIGTLDAEGYLTETIYDAGGRAVKSIRYGGQTSSADRANGTLAQLKLSAASAADQITRHYYDARGRSIATLDAEGYLTTIAYNEARSSQTTVEYAAQLSSIGDGTPLSTLVAMAASDASAGAPRAKIANYNQFGLLASTIDPEGTITNYRYDDAGRLESTEVVSITGGALDIRVSGRVYDVFGNVIVELDAIGMSLLPGATDLNALYAQHGIRHRYDVLGRCLETTDQAGNMTWYYYDAAGRQTFVVRGVADAAGHANALGEVSEIRYNAFGEVAGTVAYDRRIGIPSVGDRPTEQDLTWQLASLLATSAYTQFSYDLGGHLAQRIDADGAYTEYGYNRYGELRSETRTSNLGAALNQKTYTRDRRGLITSTYESDFVYGAARGTSQRYDAFGRLIQDTDARGVDRVFAYDKLGRTIANTLLNVDGRDLATSTAYDAFGRVLISTDALGNQTHYTYDDAAHSMTVTSPEGVVFTTIHNGFGQTVKTIRPLPGGSQAVETFEYDARGLLIRSADALGKSTQQQYDDRGLLIRTIDATNRVVEFAYDAAGRVLTRSVDPAQLNLVTRYEYDALGRQLNVTDPSGRVTAMQYDVKGQLIEVAQDPNGLNIRTSYTWDSEGHQLSVTVGAGTASARMTSYEYDGFGRRVSETIDPSGLALRVDYSYDTNGNLIARHGYGGDAGFVYDAANRLRYSINAVGSVVETRYDADGRAVAQRAYARTLDLSGYDPIALSDTDVAWLLDDQAVRDDQRDTVSYSVYDGDGRLRFAMNGAGEVAEALYDSAGRKIGDKAFAQRLTLTPSLRAQLEDGLLGAAGLMPQLSTLGPGPITRYFYDAAGRLVYTVDSVGGMTRMWYDAAGRVEKIRTFAKTANLSMPIASMNIASLDAQIEWDAGFEGENRIYDSAGRLKFQISADGVLRETRYDGAGNVTVSLRYAQRVREVQDPDLPAADSVFLSDLSTFIAANERYAAAEFNVYDAAGRLCLQMARIGTAGPHLDIASLAVVEREYDATGLLRSVYAHTQSIGTGFDVALRNRLYAGTATGADFVARLSNGRATAQLQRMMYDGAGREVYRIDGASGVLATTYTAQGNVASTRRHAIALPAGTPQTTTDVAAQLSPSARDVVEYSIHDAAGRVRFQVLGDGTVTEMRYDAQGRLVSTLQYAASLDAAQMAAASAGTATEADFAAFVSANEASARAQTRYYDATGRVRYVAALSGGGRAIVSETGYDGLGREVTNTRYGVEIAYLPGADAAAIEAALNVALSSDPALRATQIRTTRTVYDSEGHARFVLDATGALSEQRHDGIGRVIETIVYGNRPPVAATVDLAALSTWAQTQATSDLRRTRQTYDLAGQVVARNDALGQSEYFQYDTAGNILQHTDRNGAIWRYEYDQAGRRTAEISPAVAVATAVNGQTTSTTRSIVTRFQYDGLRNIVARIEDADGPASRTTRYEYDNRGHQIRTVLPDPVSGAPGSDTIEVHYDTLGLAESSKDALGNVRYKIHDNLGRVLYDVDAELQVTSYRYNAFGEEVRVVRHAKTLGVAAMQAAGWVPGQALSAQQLEAGLTLSAMDRGVESRYNSLGQKDWVLQDAVSYVRSSDRLVATGRPTLRTFYNAYGEVAKNSLLLEGTPGQSDAVWADTHYYYDALGRETVTVDAEGYVNEQRYDAHGAIWRKTEYAQRLSAGVLAALDDATPPPMPAPGDATTGFDRTLEYTYDALGRISTETVKRFVRISGSSALQPVDVTVQFGYDAEGHTTLTRDALGETRTTYDALGRTTSVQQPSRAVVAGDALDGRLLQSGTDLSTAALYAQRSPYTTIQYDAFGNVVQARQYANGRNGSNPAVADDARDRISQTRYDRRGRAVEERDLATGTIIQRNYDAGDRLTEARTVLQGAQDPSDPTRQVQSNVVTRVVYDKVGRTLQTETLRERNTIKNGVVSTAGRFVDAAESTRYNAFGEIVAKDDRLDTAFAANTPFAQYEYDNAGRMLRDNAQGGAWRDYGYDLAGRGVRMVVKSFVRNAAGATAVVDGVSDSRLDKLGRVVYQKLPSNSDDLAQCPEIRRDYDRWGNVTRLIDARNNETLYQYNDQNKITLEVRPDVKVVNRDGTETHARPTIAYFYDQYGRLVETRDPNGNSDRFVYDNVGRIVQSNDSLGNITRTAYDIFDNDIYTQNPLGYIKAQLRSRAGAVSVVGDLTTTGQAQRRWTALETHDLQRSNDRWAVTNALGHTSRYDYDTRRQLLSSRSAAGVLKTYNYDLQGHKTRETNGDADRWRYLLGLQDAAGTITGVGEGHWWTNPHTLEDIYVPEHYSGPSIRKDREGEYVFLNEQTWDYDYFGRLIDHNDLGGNDYDYTYHAVTGQLIRTTRSSALTNISVNLVEGTRATDALIQDSVDGVAATATSLPSTLSDSDRVQIYYASGLVKEIREGQNWTRYEYDVNGNRTLEETYTRDGGGNVVHLRTITTYDSNNRVSLVKQSQLLPDYTGTDRSYELVTVRYSYDAAGNRRRVTTGRGPDFNYLSVTGYSGQPLSIPSYRDMIERIAPETTFTVTASLSDGSPLPSWLTWDPATMTLHGAATTAQTLTVRLRVFSSEDQSVTNIDIPVRILPSRPPQLSFNPGSWEVTVDPVTVGWTFQTANAFYDPDGQPLQYSAHMRSGISILPMPAGMQIDPNTGVISGLPAEGVYDIVVTATDPDNQSVSKTLRLTVAATPWVETSYIGQPMDISVGFMFPDLAGAAPTSYSVVSVNGGAVPSWLQLTQSSGEWALSGTPPTMGNYNIVVRAQYANGSYAQKTLSLTVKKPLIKDIDLTSTLDLQASGDTDTGMASRIAPDQTDLVAPIYDDGGSGGGGGGGGGGGNAPPASPGAGYMYLPSNGWRSLWFDYDKENHVTVVNGRLVNGVIQVGVNGAYEKDLSYALQYDAAGRERLRIEQNGTGYRYQRMQYNERGQLALTYNFASSEVASSDAAELRTYDDAGRLTSRQDLFITPGDAILNGQAKTKEAYGYDADGRLTEVANFEGFKNFRWFGFFYDQRLNSTTTYGYDNARDGLLSTNAYANFKDSQYTMTFSYGYAAGESYLETSVTGWGTAESGSFTPASTWSTYDAWGHRIKVHDTKDRLFAFDMGGNIVRRYDEGSYYSFSTTQYAYANGQQVAATNGGWVDIVSHLTAYKSSDQGSGTTVVAAGDTLRSIAMRTYGTESLWYVLASANGLDGSETLTAGMTLRVPDVKVSSNDAKTFKPYNPGEIIGSTTPQLDYVPPPPPGNNCSVLKVILTIVVVAIIIVVTIYTAGAAAAAIAPATSAIGTAAAAGASTMAIGAGVLAGSYGFGAAVIAAAAIGGVVGSAVGQGASMLFGLSDKFDWGAVAMGGITSVAGAGIGSALSGGVQGAKAVAAAGNKLTTANVGFFNANAWAKGAAQAVGGNLVNYGANWALNRIDPSRDRSNEKFNWANLAASAVSSAVTAELGEALGKGGKTYNAATKQMEHSAVRKFANDFITNFAGSALQYNIASLLGEEGRPDYGQMATDAFGNSVANAAVRGLKNFADGSARRKQIRWLRDYGLEGSGIEIVNDGLVKKAEIEITIGEGESARKVKVRSEAVLDSLVSMADELDEMIDMEDIDPAKKSEYLKKIASHKAFKAMYENVARMENPDKFKVLTAPKNVGAADMSPVVVPAEGLNQVDISKLGSTQIAPGERLLQEIVVVGLRKGGQQSEVQHMINAVASGAEAVVAFHDEYPLLSEIAISGVQAVLTGGPVKSILMKFVKEAVGATIDNLRDSVQSKIESAVNGKLQQWGWDESSAKIGSAVVGFGFSFVTGGAGDIIDSLSGLVRKIKNAAGDLLHGRMGKSLTSMGISSVDDVNVHASVPADVVAPKKSYAQKRTLWERSVDFQGNKVYQRDDLFDINQKDWKGRTNLERMKLGLAPQDIDGKSINLHHNIQMQNGPISEMTHAMHTSKSSTIHINPNTIPSGINRKEFAAWRKDYWRNRANGFE